MSSYGTISASKVRTACEGFMNARCEYIQASREKMIDCEMQRRFFRPKTREEAAKRLGYDNFSAWNLIKLEGAYDMCEVRELLELSIAVGDGEIQVSSARAYILREFLNLK